jgi:hypothetical protein
LQLLPKSLEAVEIFEGAAVLAAGVGPIAEKEGPAVGPADEAEEAVAEEAGAIANTAEFPIAVGELGIPRELRVIPAADGLIDAGGEEAGFEARGAQQGLLGEGQTLDSAKFLGIGGLVGGGEIGLEAGDFR